MEKAAGATAPGAADGGRMEALEDRSNNIFAQSMELNLGYTEATQEADVVKKKSGNVTA